VRTVPVVFDSHLNRTGQNMPCAYPLQAEPANVPPTMVRAFRLEAEDDAGRWTVVHREHENYQRLVRVATDLTTRAVRLVPEETWGGDTMRLFAWDLDK